MCYIPLNLPWAVSRVQVQRLANFSQKLTPYVIQHWHCEQKSCKFRFLEWVVNAEWQRGSLTIQKIPVTKISKSIAPRHFWYLSSNEKRRVITAKIKQVRTQKFYRYRNVSMLLVWKYTNSVSHLLTWTERGHNNEATLLEHMTVKLTER